MYIYKCNLPGPSNSTYPPPPAVAFLTVGNTTHYTYVLLSQQPSCSPLLISFRQVLWVLLGELLEFFARFLSNSGHHSLLTWIFSLHFSHLDLSNSLHLAARMSILNVLWAPWHLFQVLQLILPSLRPMPSLPEGPACHLLWPPGIILCSFSSNHNLLDPALSLYQLCLHGFYQHKNISPSPLPSLGSTLTHLFQPSLGTFFLRKLFLLPSLGQVYLLYSHSSCPESFAYHKAIVCSVSSISLEAPDMFLLLHSSWEQPAMAWIAESQECERRTGSWMGLVQSFWSVGRAISGAFMFTA